MNAPFLRAEVRVKDTGVLIGTTEYPIAVPGYVRFAVDYVEQPANTVLTVTTGEWDGSHYLSDPYILSGACISSRPTATAPLPSPTRTAIPATNTVTATASPTAFYFEPFVNVTCSQTQVRGSIYQPLAPNVRVDVSLASDLTVKLASTVVPIVDINYSATLNYVLQSPNTRLIVSIGEWDGTQYVRPAQLFGRDCIVVSTPTGTAFVPTITQTPPVFSSATYTLVPLTVTPPLLTATKTNTAPPLPSTTRVPPSATLPLPSAIPTLPPLATVVPPSATQTPAPTGFTG